MQDKYTKFKIIEYKALSHTSKHQQPKKVRDLTLGYTPAVHAIQTELRIFLSTCLQITTRIGIAVEHSKARNDIA